MKVIHDFHWLKPPLRQGDGFTTYGGSTNGTPCDLLSALLTLRGRVDGRMRVEMESVETTATGLILWGAFLALSAFGAFGFSRYMVEILDRARPGARDR
jgi:hypothetical protein